ncbi:MAG: hypothetical protein JWP04_157 [Belnapia sp.]|nr:hypothetical protein [Belnapia sp.]
MIEYPRPGPPRQDRVGLDRLDLKMDEQTLEGFSDGVAIADVTQPDLPLIYVNSAFERITGYSRAEVLGRNCRFLQGADRRQPEIAQLAEAVSELRDITLVIRNYRKDGATFWNELRLCPLRNAAGTVTHCLGVMHDVTVHRDMTEKLRHVVAFDDVTGLLTRHGFIDRLADLSGEALAVVCCDTDQLRDVNGTYGRAAGDAVLRELGQRLGNQPGAIVASRLVAGQFALALRVEPCQGAAEAAVAALRRQVLQPYALPGATVSLTITLGWARATAVTEQGAAGPGDAKQGDAKQGRAKQGEALLIQAETALYAAKAAGRGEVRAFDPAIERNARRRLRMTAELRHALLHDEFVLHYQPKVALPSGRVIGMEALVRWQHPIFGLQTPERFMEVAEDSGLIIEIGAWALAEACRFAATLHRRGHATYVAVNVSPVQFQRDDVAALLRRALAESGAETGWVSLELTETMLADTNSRTADCFAELRRMGVGLAMDDFGTGFASLRSLRTLPFTEMKVDRSFVQNLDRDPVQAAIVGAAIAVARSLGIIATCEGVETAAERDRLVAMGCPVAQGYFFSLPLAADDLLWLLDNHATLPVPAEPAHADMTGGADGSH